MRALRFNVSVGDEICKVSVRESLCFSKNDPVYDVLLNNKLIGKIYYRSGKFFGYPELTGDATVDKLRMVGSSSLETYDIAVLGLMIYRKLLYPHRFPTVENKKIYY